MPKQILRVNASSLVLSRCTLAWYRTIVEGYKQPLLPARVVYGIASHKFVDVMFKSEGRMDLAVEAAKRSFLIPKITDRKATHLEDANHLIGQCHNTWHDYVQKDHGFEHLMLNSKCWWCDGTTLIHDNKCQYCNDTGERLQPATEVTFSIKYYEDEHFIIFLEGTIDKIGKIKNGCYAIGDYKFTSRWNKDEYLDEYEQSAPLRFYRFSLSLMAEKYPESILGQIGATRVGAFIDGIFLKPKTSEITYDRSTVYMFPDSDMDDFRFNLDGKLHHLMDAIRSNQWHHKEGIVNGTCINKNPYGKCDYYFPCKSGSPETEAILLKRDFVQKPYDPLHHNDE